MDLLALLKKAPSTVIWISLLLLLGRYPRSSTASLILPFLLNQGIEQSALSKRDSLQSNTYKAYSLDVYTEILVGTPPQPLKVWLTTESLTMLSSPDKTLKQICAEPYDLPQRTCENSGYSGLFNTTTSTSFRSWNESVFIDHEFGDRPIPIWFSDGVWATDRFTIGGTTVDDIFFLSAVNTTFWPSIGLSPRLETLSTDPYPAFIESLMINRVIQTMSWSLYLNGRGNGSVYIGAVDTEKFYGHLATFPGAGVNQRSLPLTSVHLISQGPDGDTLNSSVPLGVPIGPGNSFIDMMGLLTFLPSELYDAVFNFTFPTATNQYPPDDPNFESEYYNVPCNTTFPPEVYFQMSFNGTTIDLRPEHFLTAGTVPGMCDINLARIPRGGLDGSIILGTPFLRSAYVLLDYTHNTTSIAPIVLNATRSNVIEVCLDESSISRISGVPFLNQSVVASKPILRIVGITLSCVVGLVLVGLLTCFFRRLSRRRRLLPEPVPPPAEFKPHEAYSEVPGPREIGDDGPLELSGETQELNSLSDTDLASTASSRFEHDESQNPPNVVVS